MVAKATESPRMRKTLPGVVKAYGVLGSDKQLPVKGLLIEILGFCVKLLVNGRACRP